MKLVLQRVQNASVTIDNRVHGKIGPGLLVLAGFSKTDTEEVFEKMIHKTLNLRIFNDDAGKMNLSLVDIKGEVLLVSQFTLYADCRKGNRPSYTSAAPPAGAEALYDLFVDKMNIVLNNNQLRAAQTGIFAADMKVKLLNDGPVTIELDSDILLKR